MLSNNHRPSLFTIFSILITIILLTFISLTIAGGTTGPVGMLTTMWSFWVMYVANLMGKGYWGEIVMRAQKFGMGKAELYNVLVDVDRNAIFIKIMGVFHLIVLVLRESGMADRATAIPLSTILDALMIANLCGITILSISYILSLRQSLRNLGPRFYMRNR